MNVKVFVFPFLYTFHPMEFYKAWDEAERERKRSREPEEHQKNTRHKPESSMEEPKPNTTEYGDDLEVSVCPSS